MRWWRTVARLTLIAGVALAIPTGQVQPTTISLTTIGSAKAVDVGSDTLWVLVLGSEAPGGADVTQGLTDAIQLVGVDPGTGRAVAIGLPRDLYVDLPGGAARLNTALQDYDQQEVARQVDLMTGIAPDVVLVTGFDGFLSMMGTLGDVTVDSPDAFETEEGGVRVRRGANTFDAEQALYYARTRTTLPSGSDFDRAANHQRLLLAALERLRAAEDEEGFMERVTLSALAGLETDMNPADVYRLIQALTTIDPRRTAACIVTGTSRELDDGNLVVVPDQDQARAVGADARDDMRLQGGCRDAS